MAMLYPSVVEHHEEALPRITAASVSTFPPRECGIATYTRDLISAIDACDLGTITQVVAINDETVYRYGRQVCWEIAQHDLDSYLDAAAALSRSSVDVVNLQHEFGIFGREWGSYVLDFADELSKPLVTTLHTVLPDPPPTPRKILRTLCERSEAVVAMTPTAVDLLRRDYGVDGSRLRVIPHGVPTASWQDAGEARAKVGLAGRRVLSTFGLINPGKTIEDVIEALTLVVPHCPAVMYVVLGQTHPTIRRTQGEEYRHRLIGLVRRLGLERHVTFENRYLSDDELCTYLMATDVYVTPYENPNQIVSGTLSYALGCGRAIISTPYLYARDALADGRGLLVPFRDPPAIAEAILRVLSDVALRAQLQRKAFAFGKLMRWPRVAAAYADLFRQVVGQGARPRGVLRRSDRAQTLIAWNEFPCVPGGIRVEDAP